MTSLNHIELYVEDLPQALLFWDWLFEVLDCPVYQQWDKAGTSQAGKSWWIGETYLSVVQTVEQYLPANGGQSFNRLGVGLNHLAFQIASSETLDQIQNQLADKSLTFISRKIQPHPGEVDRDILEFEATDPGGLKIELITKQNS